MKMKKIKGISQKGVHLPGTGEDQLSWSSCSHAVDVMSGCSNAGNSDQDPIVLLQMILIKARDCLDEPKIR